MEFNGTSAAILLGVWMTFALDVFGTMNSSPQTTEINASRRADTLMKWVYLGDAVAIGGGAIASVMSKKAWPILGTAAVCTMMTLFYVYAKNNGIKNGGESTEF
jgi:hypothetical protein